MKTSPGGGSRALVVLLLSTIAAPSCAPPPVAPQAATAETKPDVPGAASSSQRRALAAAAAIDDYLASHFPAHEPGLAVLIMKRGSVVFEHGYGLADLTTRTRISPTTLFNIGSISKTFVANAILILQEEGKLSVEDDLLKYFPDFKNKSIASRVKLKHLLTHTSGLPDNREVDKNPTLYLTARDPENWYPITQADALQFEPGSQYMYSNPAFNGLALIVERLSGMRWQAFVRSRIFLPAGMTTSTITDGPHPETGVAHGYVARDDHWVESDYGEVPTFAAAGNGGVWSSVVELALYERALQRGVFLRPETVTDSRTVKTFPTWRSADPPHIGWSWFVGALPEPFPDHLQQVGHTGSQGGFHANYVTLPDKDLLFVFLTNRPCDFSAITEAILDELRKANWLD